jgi:ATP synthase protein I
LLIKKGCIIIRAYNLGKYVNRHSSWRGIIRLWLLQFGVTLALAMLCTLAFGLNAGGSVILGGLVCIIPNMYFAIKLFRHQGARAIKQIVNGFYVGEALKIMLTMILFTVVLVLFRITPLAFFGSYFTILMTHWFAPWIIGNKLQ